MNATFRPRKVRLVAVPLAVLLVGIFVLIGVLLSGDGTGVYFRLPDQIAMGCVGLLLALGVLMFTRPRVCADSAGIEVRNLLGTTRYPWQMVRAVSFPDGAAWARLELPADEYVSIMAVQAVDGAYAVTAVRTLRGLLRDSSDGVVHIPDSGDVPVTS